MPTGGGPPEAWSELASRNLAGWHEACVSALGLPTARWESGWGCSDSRLPFIYLACVTLGPADAVHADLEVARLESYLRAAPRAAVCDTWNLLDLGPIDFGRHHVTNWMVRPQDIGVAEPAVPATLEIVRVRDDQTLADFELTSQAGFEAPEDPAFTFYGPQLLANPRIAMWLGRVAGRGVGSAMAYIDDETVGIYSVAVVPAARRRGYGAALAWAATTAVPRLPALLQAEDDVTGLYRKIGYEPAGRSTIWTRSRAAGRDPKVSR